VTTDTASEARRVLAFVADAASIGGPDPFPPSILESLRELVPSASVSWHEWSVEDGHVRINVASEDPGQTVSVWQAYSSFRHQDPLPGGCAGVGRCPPPIVGSTVKLSDLVESRAFRRTGLYAEICRPLGVDNVMKLFLPVRRGLARSVVFDRCGRDFSERERDVVDQLRPHFVHLETAARTRRLAAAMLDATDRKGELVVANASGSLELATRRARRLLQAHGCLAGGSHLAKHVAAWFRDDRTASFTVVRDGARLDLTRLPRHDGAALAVARTRAPGTELLTNRELQVMALVEEGRPNADIARALWLSPGTVRKHLENVYAKLGVRNRTAAVARLRTPEAP
jgi:DNA-binding CsgD family transcriptional regulator